MSDSKKKYILHLADNALILGHRLSEWCGHGPVLEQDIAMSNIALDLIGQARNWYQLRARLDEADITEDDLAYLRDIRQYRNLLLLEQENQDFAYTVVRQFLWDSYHHALLSDLMDSSDQDLRAVAQKSFKEVQYHLKWSSEWMIRLGDGTEISHQKMQTALNDLWYYADECFVSSEYEEELVKNNVITDPSILAKAVKKMREEIIQRATLDFPEEVYAQRGGKEGIHTEQMGYILADLQYMQRTYPNAKW